MQKEIPEFIAVHILCKFDIHRTEPLFLEFEPEKYRLPVVVDDGEFFDRWIIIESSIDIDTAFIHRYLGRFRSVILHHQIYSDQYEDRNTECIELHKNPPYDEGKTEYPGGCVPTGTFSVLRRDIPREHGRWGLEITHDHIDDKPRRDGYNETDDTMGDRFRSFLLFLRCESKKRHLKSSIDDHDDRNRRCKSEDESGRIIDDLRDIAETDIPFSDLIGAHSPEYSGISICREDML